MPLRACVRSDWAGGSWLGRRGFDTRSRRWAPPGERVVVILMEPPLSAGPLMAPDKHGTKPRLASIAAAPDESGHQAGNALIQA